MRIVILGFTKIKYMPYLSMYLDQINTRKQEVHLLYWSRDTKEDIPVPDHVEGHCFNIPMEDSIPLRKKLPIIYRYSVYAKKLIKRIKPDFLIVLHSTTAYTIKSLLFHEYSGRFFLDYRDLTYEIQFDFFKRTIKRIVNHSVATFASSDGFRAVLPKINKIYTSHNIMPDAELIHEQFRKCPIQKREKIRVAFWGLLRHFEINQQIMEKLCGDSRFEVHYYGRAQGKMLHLMNEGKEKYDNFFFHGEYKPADRIKFARNTDLILNLYDKKGTILFAMGNKYYDGITFCIPQLCTEGTYMGNQCTRASVGFVCDPYKESFAEDVYQYYMELESDNFISACDIELKRIIEQVNMNNKIIRGILANEKEEKK